jgi:carbon-monoxide dehydrogenase small subunit
MIKLSLTVNGRRVAADIDPRTLLVDFLRNNQRLTGTHVGCDTSQCGACTVHLDGRSVKACAVLAASCEGAEVVTIEGLSNGTTLHPMQEAFREHHALQCGFCTPGMIMAAVDIVNRNGSSLDEAIIRQELEGNLCRCTGYHNIVRAIETGAAAMAGAKIAAE